MICLWGMTYRKTVVLWLDKDTYCLMKSVCLEDFTGSGENVHATEEASSAAELCQPQRKSDGNCHREGELSCPLTSQLGTVQGQGSILNGGPFTTELNITESGLLLFLPNSSNSPHCHVGLNAMSIPILKETDNYFWLLYTPGHFYPSQCALFSLQGHRIELQTVYDSIYQERTCPICSFHHYHQNSTGLKNYGLEFRPALKSPRGVILKFGHSICNIWSIFPIS